MEEKFNIIKKGYDPVEVNKYIDELETVIISYKEKDAAIKNAIISAQVVADVIIERAEADAAGIRVEAVRFLDMAFDVIADNRHYINSFRQDYNALISKYTCPFDDDEAIRIIAESDEVEHYISGVKEAILNKVYTDKNDSAEGNSPKS